jgi:hypothetical protein
LLTVNPKSLIVLPVSSTNDAHGGPRASGVGRLAGCLWLILAGFGFLFVAGAAGVGIDAWFVLVPLLLIPLGVAVVVFLAGNRISVLFLSAAAGFGYAGLGIWNYFRAEDFERANPGAVEISRGEVSLTLVFLTLAISAWSIGAIAVIRRRSVEDDA